MVVRAYAVVKHGKVTVLLTGGKLELVDRHSGAARRAFKSLRMKE